jgi:hypothetical protein
MRKMKKLNKKKKKLKLLHSTLVRVWKLLKNGRNMAQ